MVKTFTKDKLVVSIYENRTLMGEAAANDISLHNLLKCSCYAVFSKVEALF
jgi:hypothetical protein